METPPHSTPFNVGDIICIRIPLSLDKDYGKIVDIDYDSEVQTSLSYMSTKLKGAVTTCEPSEASHYDDDYRDQIELSFDGNGVSMETENHEYCGKVVIVPSSNPDYYGDSHTLGIVYGVYEGTVEYYSLEAGGENWFCPISDARLHPVLKPEDIIDKFDEWFHAYWQNSR